MSERWHDYWHAFRVHPARLAALRWALFGLVAFDMWAVMLEHAARYGAGDFNVAQVSILDVVLPVPTPGVIAAGWLLGGFFGLRAALGIAIRTSMIGATVCYGGIYLWSQADSYQHHYLVALLLFVACLVPASTWRGEPREDASQWPLRLLYVQVALTYFWTAVTKVDATWLTGDTMMKLTSDPCIRDWVTAFEANRGWDRGELYVFSAKAVIVGEFFAAVVFMWRRLWLIGLFVIPWFHVGVEVLGFEIEWFSYYMIALILIMLSPERVWVMVNGPLESLRAKLARDTLSDSSHAMIVAGVGTAAAVGLALQVPFSSKVEFAAIVGIFALLALWPLDGPRPAPRYGAVVHGIVGVAMLLTLQVSESAYDFYRMWGGDLRRRGQVELAIEKYQHANAIMGERPARRYQLGQLYERRGQYEDALPLFRESHAVYTQQVSALTRESLRAPTDVEALHTLAGDQLRLSDRCRALARAERRAGNADAAQEAQNCRSHSLDDAEDTLNRAAALKSCDPREGNRLRRQLRKSRGQ